MDIKIPETVECFLHKFSCVAHQMAALLDLLDCKGGIDPFIEGKVIEILEKIIVPLYTAALHKNPNLICELLASAKVLHNYNDKNFKDAIIDKIRPTEEQIQAIKVIYATFECDIARINEVCDAIFKSIDVQGTSISIHDRDREAHYHQHIRTGGMHNALWQTMPLVTATIFKSNSGISRSMQMETMCGYISLARLMGKLETFQERFFATVLKLSDSLEFTLTPIQRCRYIALVPSRLVDYIKLCQVLADDNI